MNLSFTIRPSLLIALVVNLVVIVVASWWLTPAFDSINDDAGMNMIASGFFTGSPNEYLVLMNVFIGQILKVLYHITDEVNWYTVFLYSVQYFSSSFILYTALKQWGYFKGWLFFALFYVTFGLSLFFRLQFTSTGFLPVLAAILYLFHLLGNNIKIGKKAFYILLVLFGTAYLIRYQIFYGSMLFLLPLLAYEYYLHKRKIVIQLAFALLILYVPIRLYDRLMYQIEMGSPNFLDFLYSAEVLANDPLDYTKIPMLENIGWSFSEVQCCTVHFWSDEKVFARDKVIYAAKVLASKTTLEQVLLTAKNITIDMWYFIFLVLLPFVFVKRLNAPFFKIFLPIILSCSIILLLIVFARTPYRAVISFVMLGIMCTWWLLFEHIRISKRYTLLLVLIAVMPVLYRFFTYLPEANKYIESQKASLRVIDKDFEENPTVFHITSSGFYPSNALEISTSPTKYLANNFLITGWCNQSPFHKEVFKQHGYKDAMDMALHSEKAVFMGMHYSMMQGLIGIVKNQYQRECKLELSANAAAYSSNMPVVIK